MLPSVAVRGAVPIVDHDHSRRRAPGGPRVLGLAVVTATLLATGTGFLYHYVWAHRQLQKLERMPSSLAVADRASWKASAARERVLVARLAARGETLFRTGPVPVHQGAVGQMLDATEAQLGPWPAREEVQAALAGRRAFGRYEVPARLGSVLVQTLAEPVPEGGVLYIITGFHFDTFHRPEVLAVGTLILGLITVFVSIALGGLARPPERPVEPR